ncbi:MAG: MFS transporter [Calditrichaeota bacterium]|nr:MFS transporter [Calditrichota bacterium]
MSHSRLPADVKRLGWVSFFTDISSEMLYAITPIFLTSVLGASAGIVGLIEGVAEATASILKGLSGWYSDRIRNRKRFILAGYSLSALAKPLIAMATGWLFVLVARFLDRFGKGIRSSARDALIADATPPELRGRAFGLHRAMDTAGALLGVAISLVLLQTLGESGKQQILLRNLYWIAFFPALIGVAFIFFVREPHAGGTAKLITHGKKLGKHYWMIVAVAGVAYLGFSSDAFLILKAKDIGLTLPQVLLAYIAYNAVFTLAAYPVGKISDKLRKETLLAAGLGIYGAVYLGFAAAESRPLVFLLFACYGLYAALTEGVVRALIANVVAPDVKATALGLFSMVTGLLALAASLLAGWLWDAVSSDAPFLIGALMSLIAAAGFAVLTVQKRFA